MTLYYSYKDINYGLNEIDQSDNQNVWATKT